LRIGPLCRGAFAGAVRTGESACGPVENPKGSIGFGVDRTPFQAESCDPDVTLLDNMFFEGLKKTKTPKKAATAPVFCFTH
jgi:hypothetical protein